MRVMCISNQWHAASDSINVPNPEVGDIDTVIEEEVSGTYGGTWYQLERFPGPWYKSDMFAPLSDLDETELVTEEFQEKYCIPVNSKS